MSSSLPARLAFVIPFTFLLLYALASYPMMYPGFDIWIHLTAIEFNSRRDEPWYDLLRNFFTTFGLSDPFEQARLVHVLQVTLSGVLVFFGARWILRVADREQLTSTARLSWLAWFSVMIWLLMHGTVSAAINNPTPVWYAWMLWYSVNYQVTLPMFVFAVGALLYGFAADNQMLWRQTRLPYFALGVVAIVGVAAFHAAEIPYVAFGILLITILWFRWSWRWQYLAALVFLTFSIYIGLQFSYRLPEGLIVFNRGGWPALLDAIENRGVQMTERGYSRGNASWNFWYWVTASMATVLLLTTFFKTSLAKRLNWRVPCFVLLSATMAAMIQFKETAGLIAMVTGLSIAWRFTFSSFLFMAPGLALLALGMTWPALQKVRWQVILAFGLIGSVLMASRFSETNLVSYRYARSLALSLSAEQMRFDLTSEQASWLNQVHEHLQTNPPKNMICTDMFTAYYLFFIKDYHQVVLPNRISRYVDRKRKQPKCGFPRDGGDIKSLGFGPIPWDLDINSPN